MVALDEMTKITKLHTYNGLILSCVNYTSIRMFYLKQEATLLNLQCYIKQWKQNTSQMRFPFPPLRVISFRLTHSRSLPLGEQQSGSGGRSSGMRPWRPRRYQALTACVHSLAPTSLTYQLLCFILSNATDLLHCCSSSPLSSSAFLIFLFILACYPCARARP